MQVERLVVGFLMTSNTALLLQLIYIKQYYKAKQEMQSRIAFLILRLRFIINSYIQLDGLDSCFPGLQLVFMIQNVKLWLPPQWWLVTVWHGLLWELLSPWQIPVYRVKDEALSLYALLLKLMKYSFVLKYLCERRRSIVMTMLKKAVLGLRIIVISYHLPPSLPYMFDFKYMTIITAWDFDNNKIMHSITEHGF